MTMLVPLLISSAFTAVGFAALMNTDDMRIGLLLFMASFFIGSFLAKRAYRLMRSD